MACKSIANSEMSNALVTYKQYVSTNDSLKRMGAEVDINMCKEAYKNKCKVGDTGILCHCKFEDGRPIEIRKLNDDVYVTRRRKNGQDDHLSDCAYGKNSHATATEYLKPIAERDGHMEAHVNVKLNFTEEIANSKEGGTEQQYPDDVTKPSQRKADPVALLYELIEKTGINRWECAQVRSNKSVFERLNQEVAAAKMNEKPMKDNLYVAIEGDSPELWEQKKEALKTNSEKTRKGTLVMGEIGSFHFKNGKIKFRLKGIQQFFRMSEVQFRAMRTSYPRILRRIRKANGMLKNCRITFFGVISVGHICDVRIETMNLCLMSRDYIPCDSYLEVRVAHQLVKEGRKFLRVLRPMDVNSKYMADFELLDMGKRWVMEIFGMRTLEYLAVKKEKKIFWENTVGNNFWEWDVVNGLVKIPGFPPLPIVK